LGYNRGFDQFFQFSNTKQRYGLMGADSQKITRALKNFIKEKPEKKFFIYLHLLYLHQPYNPPAPYQNMFGPGYNFHQTLQQLKKTDREGMINNYDGEIRMTDDLIKNIFELLKKYQLLENTYVIITADHGEGFFDHGQVDHGNSLHGELLKIPLIIHLPKNSKLKPKIVAESASNIALFPTLIELAQITKIPECSGQSLFKLFARKPPAISNPKIFSESPYKNSPFQLSFQNRDFKIIYEQPGNFFSIWEELAALGTAKCQLYAIKADTEEKNNLASRRPLTKILLAYQVIKHKKDNFKKRNALKDIDTSFLPDKETLENLRSLGYLQ
jgi:arylsulfatase A-like enzyme